MSAAVLNFSSVTSMIVIVTNGYLRKIQILHLTPRNITL